MRVNRIGALRGVTAGLVLAAVMVGVDANGGLRAADVTGPAPRTIFEGSGKIASPAELDDQAILAALKLGSDNLLARLGTEIEEFKKQLAGQNKGGGRAGANLNTDRLAGDISIAVYALLTVGKVTGDERFRYSSKEMAEPIKIIEALRTHYTYALAFHASALALLPHRPELRKRSAWDLDQLLHGNVGGVYTYHTQFQNTGGAFGDHSNTQYGELGVWTCQDQGLEVPNGYWEAVDRHWRSRQLASGAWNYMTAMPSSSRGGMTQGTATMTCAGVASLFLAKDALDFSVRYNPVADASIDAGLLWLTAQYPLYTKGMSTNLYLAYALERVALYGGLREIGSHDWYRDGATVIINAQKPDGSFGSMLSDTAYGLLFLSRGLAPVGIAKLQYKGPWDARSRDCARFIHWFGKESERPLNWQTVSIDSNPATWGNIPMLVITGHDDPQFTPAQIGNLRRYVEGGGLIFSSADDGNAAFTRMIREKYAPALFDGEYEMRALPPEHAAFTLNYKVPKRKQPRLFGLSNGVREVWIHSADDVTGSWQSYSVSKSQNFDIPANIFYYTLGHTEAGIHYPPLTPPDPPTATMTLHVARVEYAGNWDPEPAAWGHFAARVRQDHAAIIQVIPTKIADLDPAKTPVAVMTGTAAFTLSDEDRVKLADYLAKGGRLLADAAGGSEAFGASFTALMGQMYPGSALSAMGADSPVLTGDFANGAATEHLAKRPYAGMPGEREKGVVPMALLQGGKVVVVFSPGDLTAGLAGLRDWGIRGYMPAAAEGLTWNSLLLLTGGAQAKVPASAPGTAATVPAGVSAPGGTDRALPPTPPVEESRDVQ